MGTDKDEKLMILEFKSRKAGTNAVKQLKGYVECFMDNKEFILDVKKLNTTFISDRKEIKIV